jgi:hypothetical protein
VFITNDVKIVDNNIILGNLIKGLKKWTPRVTNLVSLQFKEYIRGRLYQIRLNYIKPYIDLSNTQYVLRFLVLVFGMWTPSRNVQKYTKSSDYM